jgi:hypothetical protein
VLSVAYFDMQSNAIIKLQGDAREYRGIVPLEQKCAFRCVWSSKIKANDSFAVPSISEKITQEGQFGMVETPMSASLANR